MTEQQKAKSYDDALKRAKDWIDEREQLIYPREIVENIFPELQVSEDEKIRKEIISIVKSYRESCITEDNHRFDDCIAWLEKQKEKEPVESKDDERLRKTTIAFLEDFANQGYENVVECIDWLEK